jgi:hypothetical protein
VLLQGENSGEAVLQNRVRQCSICSYRQRLSNAPLTELINDISDLIKSKTDTLLAFEAWVFRRRAYQRHPTILDKRQEQVLLRFREAMDFIDK